VTSAVDSDAPIGQSKKAKKNQANKTAAALALDVGDRAALNKRAERFRREHELEKQKQNGGGQASSFRNNQRLAHAFINHSRSATPSANADDPEVDPVRVCLLN
jgi:SAC3 family protein LENG8/THP3